MICVSLSDILYPDDTLSENSCIVCTHLSLLYAPAVTLHSIRMMFTLMIFIGTSDSCHCRVPLQHTIRRKSQQQTNVARFCKIYPIGIWVRFSWYCCWRESPAETLHSLCPLHRENVKFHASDTALFVRFRYRAICMILREWQFSRCYSKICCLSNSHWLEYSMLRFKVRQTKLIIIIAQIYHRKVAHGKDVILASQYKRQRHVWTSKN